MKLLNEYVGNRRRIGYNAISKGCIYRSYQVLVEQGRQLMAKQSRTSRVFISLVASMTLGALVLMALDSHPLSAGAFSLASYTRLNSVEEAALKTRAVSMQNWDRIEVHYSRTDSGDIDQLAELHGLSRSGDINYHFVICNGSGGKDGLIEAAEKWQMQRPCLTEGNWYGSRQTIRICVIGDGFERAPTDSQIKRTAGLVDLLSREFEVSPSQIAYPSGWQL